MITEYTIFLLKPNRPKSQEAVKKGAEISLDEQEESWSKRNWKRETIKTQETTKAQHIIIHGFKPAHLVNQKNN